jgi:polysaccharide pyruvyl transferase CsaB
VGARTDVDAILAVSDVFVGVSRAAREGMSAGLPTILAGFQGYIGPLTRENIDAAAGTNFTCRGCGKLDARRLAADLETTLAGLADPETRRLGEFTRAFVAGGYSTDRMARDCIRAYDAARARPRRVLMSGYYGFGNAGDEAILQAVHDGILREGARGGARVTVLSNNPGDTRARYGYKTIRRFNVPGVLLALARCDALVSGGGSLLQDQTSTRSLLYYLWIMRAAELMGKTVMVYANGIGPINRERNRRRVRRVVGRADVITLRDGDSATQLREMGVERGGVEVSADPAFTLYGIPSRRALEILAERGIPIDKPIAAVSAREMRSAGGNLPAELAALCDGIYERHGYNILFIAMQYPGDLGISARIGAAMRNPSHVLDGRFSSEELMGIVGASALAVSMRLHALIFAARMAVPFAAVVCDPKLESYAGALGLPPAGNAANFSGAEALETVGNIIARSGEYRRSLRERSREMEAAARRDPRRLIEALGIEPESGV